MELSCLLGPVQVKYRQTECAYLPDSECACLLLRLLVVFTWYDDDGVVCPEASLCCHLAGPWPLITRQHAAHTVRHVRQVLQEPLHMLSLLQENDML